MKYITARRDFILLILWSVVCSFIGTFLGNPPEPERDSQSVQDFLTTTEDAFKAHPLWAGATDDEFESSGEVIYFFARIVICTILTIRRRNGIALSNHHHSQNEGLLLESSF